MNFRADQPKGAYRKLCVRPQNVTHKILQYNDSDPVDSFIPSAMDKLSQGKSCKNGESQVDKPENGDAVMEKTCVIVEMSLPSSSYATMALREIMQSNSETQKRIVEPESDEKDIKSEEPEAKKQKVEFEKEDN